ncbi:hypothetical protein THRCLA_22281 [Thraustotheca clavata]|uniref:FYVE-type domain-containing protein n=1 Tax=Thraustotheca clavata TaxID=74557 RepID=A0A1V9Z730_9STRA|nr:hypothetical protein THRCLA_22281 [Thraustotheca clavata]
MQVPTFLLPMLSKEEEEAIVAMGATAFTELLKQHVPLSTHKKESMTFHAKTLIAKSSIESIGNFHINAIESSENYCRTFHCLLTSVLYTLIAPSAQHPYQYVAVRWMLLPATLPSTHGFVRGHFYNSGMVTLDERMPKINAYMRLQWKQTHSFPARCLTKSLCKAQLRHFDTLNERLYVHYNILPRKISISGSTWRQPTEEYASPLSNASSACTYCMQQFTLIRRPTLCETCNQILCKKCTRRITKSSKYRVCLTCYVRHEIEGCPRPIYRQPAQVHSPCWSELCHKSL